MTVPAAVPAVDALPRMRAAFPALQGCAWLNTPGFAPACAPVTEALRAALHTWETGRAEWEEWEREGDRTRELLARLVGGQARNVALVTSLAEAAGIVAQSLRREGLRGTLVVPESEFRSNLLPWTALADSARPLRLIPTTPGPGSWTARVLSAIGPRTALVAISEVQSLSGWRVDLPAVAERCRAVGARLFANLTQSAGVLPVDLGALRADYAAAHGYKWLLAPRGAAWLHVREDRIPRTGPIAPNWHNPSDSATEMYGPAPGLHGDARRVDASLAWLSWVGAAAALRLLLDTPGGAVTRQALALADRVRAISETAGTRVHRMEEDRDDPGSPVVSLELPQAEPVARRLAGQRIRVSVRAGRIRVGCHGFNTTEDVERLARGLGPGARQY